MSLTKRKEAYAQNVADGGDELEAMAAAGYKAKNKANSERQLRNLNADEAVQDRITELRAIKLLETGEDTDGEDAAVVELVSALHFFQTVYKNPAKSMKERIACASIAIQYEEPKPAPIGKKEQGKIDAKTATNTGSFRTLSNQLPLTANNTKQ